MPRIFMNSLVRPLIHRYPSSSRQARSPVLSQPSTNFRSVASRSSKYPEQTEGPRTWISPVCPAANSRPSSSTIRIVDDEGRELAAGQTGEIQVRGPSVCSGYFDDREATERKFVDGWLKTGDLACRDDEGYLWIKGRTSEFIKIRGIRVGFGEIETKVAAVPGVYACAATTTRQPEP